MEHIGTDIKRELSRFGPAAGVGPIVEAWPLAVGEAIAANAWPARLSRDGTLHVHAKDSIWAFELQQRAEEIRERLGDVAPKALRFVAGPVPGPSNELPPEPAREVVRPGPEETARAAELTASIAGRELRESVARAAALSLARAAADRRF